MEDSEGKWDALMKSTLTALKVHMELEEEIFYPAYLAATNAVDRHHDAMVEHEGAKKLIADIENSDPGDDYYEAMIRVLWKMVKDHMTDEERSGGMLSILQAPTMDLLEIGRQIAIRREELVELMGIR